MRSNIEEITSGRSGKIIVAILDAIAPCTKPHELIEAAYDYYLQEYPNNPALNGRVFEYLVCETLARENIVPFYYQAKFALVPNADFDVVCYNPDRPVVLSMKVSLRERYKQADLEGFALRQVYRNAESYLITLSPDEGIGVSKKIVSGEIAGLTACILADTPDYSALLNELKTRQFTHAESIMPLAGKVFPVSNV